MTDDLIISHIPYMERIVMDVCRNVPRSIQAEELYGASYLALVKAARSFCNDRGAEFRTWAYRPIRTAAQIEAWWLINWRSWIHVGKNRSPTITDFEDWRDDTEDDSADPSAFFYDLARDYVKERIDELEQPEQTVIRMSFIDGVPQSEIAAKIGKSVQTVRHYKRRGLDALWEALASEEKELTELLETRPRRVDRNLAKYHARRAYGRADGETAHIRMNAARLHKREAT